MKELAKNYDPSIVEERLYEQWMEKKYFHTIIDKSKKPYCIVMPPPNITGQLHMGHALDNTIQDILIRWKRMEGYNTLWLPGIDHASISTELKVVQKMAEEGLTKADVGREGFLERAWAWKEEYGGIILNQIKKLGSSCDWERVRFTMDEGLSDAVLEVFVRLYEKGYVYRGEKIVNWCPECQTTISDAEVNHVDTEGHFYHINYPIVGSDENLLLATTRPETMLGDTAVAVHPDDERYQHLIGKKCILPLVGKEIPIVADSYVDREFGTGVVKITPAHDPNDFEVGVRHNLERINVLNDDGTMNENAGKYQGMDRYEAREKIVAELKEQGYLVKIEDITHAVGTHERCNKVVEPMIKLQWFVKMEELAKPAIDIYKDKSLRFIPDRFGKVYLHWLDNIKDWCISRQLWWGHRIPAYYCEECGHMVVSEEAPTKCPKCSSTSFRQDEDVLDTWFSSALWPFSTLGYPEKTKDLKYFYPTSLLVTAYDIIFFWVARMIFSGVEHMGEIPFPEVLIHGIVRDSEGRKMSKSLGNGIDPLELIDKYGADSLRFSLLMGVAPGGDIRYSKKKTEDMSAFMNKIWNASRFVLLNLEGNKIKELGTFRYTPADKWILARLNRTIKEVTANLAKYELGLAATKLYNFVWNEFCDWYIELAKPYLYGDNQDKKINTLSVLVYVMKNILKLLHPFIPFITEEIYLNFPHDEKSVMISDWPVALNKFSYKNECESFENVMGMITTIRNIRAEMNVSPSKPVRMMTTIGESSLSGAEIYIKKLAGVTDIEYIQNKAAIREKVSSAVTSLGEILIPLGDLVDTEKEIERIQKEIDNADKEIARCDKMLRNEGFLAKAPKNLIEQETVKLGKYREKREKLTEQLAMLKS